VSTTDTLATDAAPAADLARGPQGNEAAASEAAPTADLGRKALLDADALPPLGPSLHSGDAPIRSIAALADVEMTVSVELGRTKIAIRDLLSIRNGAVVQLDRSITHPVDVLVHGTLIARGEVVVVDDCFAVRVTELLTGE
jgi:flagellar motor switch protein FliN/FliY